MSVAAPNPTAGHLPGCRQLLAAYSDSLHIKEQVEALEEALPERPGQAITYCRSIIETTCKAILDERSIQFNAGDEAPRLLKAVMDELPLTPSHHPGNVKLDDAFSRLLGGLNGIAHGIVAIRNELGTGAHGPSPYAPVIDAGHAEFVASVTDLLVGFLYRIHKNSLSPVPKATDPQYEDEPDFNDSLDDEFGSLSVHDVEIPASKALFAVDSIAYATHLAEWRVAQDAAPPNADDTTPKGATT